MVHYAVHTKFLYSVAQVSHSVDPEVTSSRLATNLMNRQSLY